MSLREVIILQTACEVAQRQAAENAEFDKRCANNQHLSKTARDGAARVAKWYQERADAFKSASKALDEGRELTTLDQAKEALER